VSIFLSLKYKKSLKFNKELREKKNFLLLTNATNFLAYKNIEFFFNIFSCSIFDETLKWNSVEMTFFIIPMNQCFLILNVVNNFEKFK